MSGCPGHNREIIAVLLLQLIKLLVELLAIIVQQLKVNFDERWLPPGVEGQILD